MSLGNRINEIWKESMRHKGLIGLALPGLLFVLVFSYMPMFGVIVAFKDFNFADGFWGSPWVGFKNFEFFFKSDAAWQVTRNTIGLNLSFIALSTVVSISFALMLMELTRRSVKVFQTTLFFPYFLSWVVVSYVTYALLNPQMGVMNGLLERIGMEPINWYLESKYWPFILCLAYLWKNVGYSTLIIYTGLLGIDKSYYEAAAIDGATRWQQIIRISIPLIAPLIILVTLLQVGRIFYSDFGMFYFLTADSGALYETTDVIDTYVFRALRVSGDIGMASAVGLYQSIVGFVLVVSVNWVVRKINRDNAIF
ncbi:sugar ABC transporter permease [Cohnella sp. CIP 111063]|jgi:putative aldouronate transport system permease protein|uniref:ABC transporter permease n=1 Tax=unclassified Cohnella TaxID=2636738 RepID=UPI000B8BF834|nr:MULTISPECIES: ABC transporter permease subunit [unclassified Cohnella]OXS59227.1 sugar ABC transporter permease [Cohnella sp. CIP 111063]PRX72241.1 putative aldouronate transport system permease protein [Cohnella sp. SGD-V74]